MREPYEYDIARIPGARLIPLGELPSRMSELDSAQEIALHCKTGKRSAQALRTLREAGFSKLTNVHGGIEAWADEIDPSVPKYYGFAVTGSDHDRPRPIGDPVLPRNPPAAGPGRT